MAHRGLLNIICFYYRLHKVFNRKVQTMTVNKSLCLGIVPFIVTELCLFINAKTETLQICLRHSHKFNALSC